jgi:hypothetical protein
MNRQGGIPFLEISGGLVRGRFAKGLPQKILKKFKL